MARRPKPTALKVLAGTRSDRVNAAEPVAPVGAVAPDHLDDLARAEWSRIAPILDSMRVLTAADSSALAIYCQTYSRWAQAEDKIRERGLIELTEKGQPLVSPYVRIARDAMAQCQRMLAEFGCTPSSRSRIHTSDAPRDALSEFCSV